MGHNGLFATSAEILAKMGDNYETDVDETMINAFCLQAEAFINIATRYDWSGEFTAPATTTLSTSVWYMLGQAESDLVAIWGLTYKPTGESGTGERIEFEDRINILRDDFLRCISILRDKKSQTFAQNA